MNSKIRFCSRFSLVISGLLPLIMLSSTAGAITRVRPLPEVGKHVFQAEFGGAGTFEELSDNGTTAASLGWSYHADNNLGFGLMAGFSNPEETLLPTSPAQVIDGSFSYLTAVVHVRAPTRAGFVPRIQAGFGYYDFEFKNTEKASGTTLETFGDQDFGMFLGAGLDYLVTPNLGLGIVGNYHFISLNQPDSFGAPRTPITGLGEWFDTWDVKAVVSIYTH